MSELLKKNAIDSQELEELLRLRAEKLVGFLLIDVREPSEFERGHIAGVDFLMPGSEVFMWADEFCENSADNSVILTCRTGMRSGRLQRFLKDKGHSCVINHAGGIVSYNGLINTLEREPA